MEAPFRFLARRVQYNDYTEVNIWSYEGKWSPRGLEPVRTSHVS
jgi:hypothetical protein